MNIENVGLAELLCSGGRILSYKGLNESFGHLSVRIPNEDQFLITTRRALAFVKPSDIEIVSFSGEKLTHNSAEGAPNEVFLHAEVYKARSDVNAIARTQSHWCEVFGVVMEPVKPLHDFGAVIGGDTAILDLPTLGDAKHVGEELVTVLGFKNAALLRGNGNVVLGGSIPEAVVRAIFLDESARIQYEASLLAPLLGKEVKYFDPYEVRLNGQALSRPDRIQRAWDNYYLLATAAMEGFTDRGKPSHG